MSKSYIIYYPIGGRQTALNILQLLSTGVPVSSLDLPRGYRVEELAPLPPDDAIEELYDLGGEG